MNWFYISFQLGICVKIAPQIVHSNAFFSPWTESMCHLMNLFLQNKSLALMAYFLHELIPNVLSLHRNLTWKNTWNQFMKEKSLFYAALLILVLHRNPTWKNTWNLFMKERSLFFELKYPMCPYNWVFCVNLFNK